MKKSTLILFLISLVFISSGYQNHYNTNTMTNQSFKTGEWLKFRVHYGIINAGYATLEIKDTYKNGEAVHHAIGNGWTIGAAGWVFDVEDKYDSYFTKGNIKPIEFTRRVDEGGYIIKRDLHFDYMRDLVTVNDIEENTTSYASIGKVQDMLSTLYYLRNIDLSTIVVGDEIEVDLFFDGETYTFKLKFLAQEEVKIKLGKIKAWKIRPIVQKGRVFKEKESLTIWISDDKNKIPIRIKANLAVGSLKADLDDYSGLAHDFDIID